MKFVIEEANFCPRVLTIPDEDIPQVVLDVLLKISDENGMIVKEYDQIRKDMYKAKDTPAHKIAGILLAVHENIICSYSNMKALVPNWTRRARITKHRSFNTQHLLQDCDFYFIEEDHLDGNQQYIPPLVDDVDQLLASYLVPQQLQDDTEEQEDHIKENNEDQVKENNDSRDCPENWEDDADLQSKLDNQVN